MLTPNGESHSSDVTMGKVPDSISEVRLLGNDSSGGELELARHTVELLERLVASSSDDAEASQQLHDLGQLLLHPLDEPLRALAALRSAHQRQPSIHTARGYRKAALRCDSRDDVLLALESESRLSQGAAKAGLEEARAVLLLGIDNPAAARLAYEAALVAQPTDLAALSGLMRLDLADGQIANAADRCRALGEAVTDAPAKADILTWAARLAEQAGKLDVARASLVQAELHAPTSLAVRFLAERLLADSQPRALATQLEAQIADGSLAPAEGWFEIGQLARYTLDDAQLAERAFAKALEALPTTSDPGRGAALVELAELRAAAGQAKESIQADEERLATEIDPVEQALAWTRIGALREDATQDLSGAADAYGKAVDAAPAYIPALEGAGRTYGKLRDADRLLAVHLAEAEQTAAPAEKAAALRRAGEMLLSDASRVEIGIGYLDAASRLAPEHAGIFLSLERALRKRRDFAALCDLYERELAHATSPRRRAGLHLQIGALSADQLGDTKRAILAYRAAAAISGGAPDHALANLARLLDESDELEALEPVLAELTTLTDDPVQIASLYERAGLLREQRGDVDGAVNTYLKALADAPASHSIHAAAGRAFARAGRWDAVLSLYERTALDASPPVRASYGYKAGFVLARRLHRVDDGIAQLERVRAEQPDHLPTVALLAALYTEQRRWPALRAVLGSLPQTPSRGVRRALLAESLGHLDEAFQLWSDPAIGASALAERAQLRLLARLGRWAELADSYEQAATSTETPSASARYRAAELRLERTSEPERARTLLTVAVGNAPDSVGLRLALLRSTPPTDPARASLLASLVELVQDGALRAQLQTQLAALPSLTDDERIAALTRVLALAPRDPIASVQLEAKLEALRMRAPLVALLRALQRDGKLDDGVVAAVSARLGLLLEELGSAREAIDSFEMAASTSQASLLALLALPRLYRAIGDAPKVRVALEGLAAAMPRGAERVPVLRRLATDQRLGGEKDAAVATLEWALREEPRSYEALRELDLLVGANAPERIVDALMRALPFEPPGAQRLDVGMALAVRQVKMDRLDPARETLDRVLADDPQHLRAHLLSAELETRAGRTDRACIALAAIGAHADAPPVVKKEALYRLAKLQLAASDLDAARSTAKQLDGSDLATRELQLAIAERAQSHAEVAVLLERLVNEPSLDDERRADAQLRLADVLEQELDDVDRAISVLGGIRLPSRRRDAVDRLLDLGGKSGRWDLTASSLEATLDRAGDMEVGWEIAIRRRLAILLEGPLERGEAALRQYERIVALDPSDVPTLERLAELSVGTPDKAIDYHRALLAADPARLASYRALRGLFTQRGDEDGAFLVDAMLEAVGVADEEESYFYKQRRARLRTPLDGTLSEGERALLAPEASLPAFALLHVLTPVLDRVFPVDFAAYGAPPEPAAYTGPLAAVADKIARLFSVPRHRIVPVPSRVGPCVEPPALLFVPRAVEEAPPREQATVLAELFARLAFDGIAGDPRRSTRMSTSMMEYLLWAACEVTLPDVTAPHRGRPVYEDIKRRVAEVVAELPRAELEAAARRVVAEPVAGDVLFETMDRIACRAALLCAQDPVLALASLRERFGAPGAGFVALAPALRAALSFVLSSGHLLLRRRLQMGVSA